jgi:hypothetical protein
VEAPVVYVGFGVTAPEKVYDDYWGIDAKGKIVAMASGAPGFESAIKAHYSAWELKQANAAAHGATGIILISEPVSEGIYPYSKMTRDIDFPKLQWLDRQNRPNDYFPELKGLALLSPEKTKQIFDGSGHTAEQVLADIKLGKPKSFPLPIAAKIYSVICSKTCAVRTWRKRGIDPDLKKQYVVTFITILGSGTARQRRQDL